MFRLNRLHTSLAALILSLTTTMPAPAAPAPPGQTTKTTTKVYACDMWVSVAPGAATVTKVEAPGFGQLGDVQFEPGDVIDSIGGVKVAPGVSLDTLINKAVSTGNRTVTVRDKNSGQVLTLVF